MQFTLPTFLFLFFPFTFILYFFASRKYKNFIALVASLVFFAWGQVYYLPLMLGMIGVNFYLGKKVEENRDGGKPIFLRLGVGLNLALLLACKLLATYASAWFGKNTSILVPLGLSYITFQVIAYLLDIHNEMHDSEKNLLHFALYVLFFPKIITGPITRYRDLGAQIAEREVTGAGIANGARRFITGFAKKALIADQIARIVTPALALPSPSFSPGIAWVVLIGYALQLYFDFSGYVDMAIGLGQMFGFRFVENFNYPYISQSISEFWRRWHISLSSWFRDYVFYPLEFATRRGRKTGLRQQGNILIVFLLTGLWHGLTLNFVLWGLLHGLAIALEMSGLGRWLKKAWRPLGHIYTLGVVLVGWVFFASPNVPFALAFFARLAGSAQGEKLLPFAQTKPLPIIENSVWLALALGILFSVPLVPAFQAQWQRFKLRYPRLQAAAGVGYDLALLVLLVAATAATASANLVATIYGGF
jgi:alginate O-acetyltransferase complex protein AlgI